LSWSIIVQITYSPVQINVLFKTFKIPNNRYIFYLIMGISNRLFIAQLCYTILKEYYMNKTVLLFTIFSVIGFTSATKSQTNIKNNLTGLGIPLEKTKENSQLINIAFFGVDRLSTSDFGNSDLIMIISIDTETKKVKLSSIMRDTYVKIYARGQNKINAAYFEGGPQLAIRTLNENFDL